MRVLLYSSYYTGLGSVSAVDAYTFHFNICFLWKPTFRPIYLPKPNFRLRSNSTLWNVPPTLLHGAYRPNENNSMGRNVCTPWNSLPPCSRRDAPSLLSFRSRPKSDMSFWTVDGQTL